ncbi:MAG: hypothetical protein GY851_25170 [bacterium]|nr:hypothetical protein [bacterium]
MVNTLVCGMVALLAATMSAAPEADAPGAGVVYYVAPDGNDAWSGTRAEPDPGGGDGPFATVGRAVDVMRALKKAQGGVLQRPVTIVLRGGTHYLGEPVALGPDDSGTESAPVTFRAAEGERAVISGGRPITNWRKVDDHLWQTDLEAVRAGDWHFRTLRVGQARAIRARYPNFDPELPRKGGWLFARKPAPKPNDGFFGVGVHNIHNANDRLEWELDIPAEGDYTVWVWYGHKMKAYGRDTMDGDTEFGVVDGPVAALVDMPDTGGWTASRWARGATVHLAEGEQTLYWRNKNGGGLNLDAFCLSSDPNWTPADKVHIQPDGTHTMDATAEGTHAVLFHAEKCSKAVGPEIRIGQQQEGKVFDRVTVDPADLPDWTDWTGAEMHIFPAWGWVNTILAVEGVDRDESAFRVTSPQDIRPGNRFYVEGVREALDAPGEWYLDQRAGALTYWPDAPGFPEVDVVAPLMDRLFELRGDPEAERFVEHVRFEDLMFMDTDYHKLNETYSPADATVIFAGAAHCVVEQCEFKQLSGYAVRLEQRSHDNEVVGCAMTELGQGGVLMVGDADTQAHDNLVAANAITDCGAIYKHVAGVYITTGSDNRILNNRIHRMPRYAISLKSYNEDAYSHGNVVEFNEIIDTNLETNDTGAIETLGRDRVDSGNVIRHNLIRNVVGMKTSPEGEILSPHFTWGIYLDDYSSGTLVEGNIVDGTVIGGFCIHGGKNNRIENNIFLNASEQQLRLQPRDDFMAGNTFLHNIVAYHEAESTLWYAYSGTWRPDRLSACDNNLYWCYGDLDIATTDQAITAEGSYQQWREAGLDTHSIVADPLFESPTLDHFALKPESPALKLGHKPIPEDRIGPEGFRRDEIE